MDELKMYIEDKHIDVCGVAETWLNDEITSSEININGIKI